jgi:glycosyltransferase involved in cell wall biosynthesis
VGKHHGSAAVTIVARNYLPFARTLLASLAAMDPSIDRYAFVLDARDVDPDFAEGVVLTPTDVFDYEFFAGLAYSYDITELATSVKPFVLRYLLSIGYERAFYFDPDIEVYRSLEPVTRPLDDADVVLTPHTTDPIPLDGFQPDELVLLRAGTYNLGFIGVARTNAALAMLNWWADRLERYCVNDVSAGLFTDQKWIDLVPGMLDRVAIVRHRGCNVAYWNLHGRRIDPDDPRRLMTGEQIVFYHFSGFDVLRPDRLSKHQTRFDVESEPGLARLLAAYSERVLANGFREFSQTPYAFARFNNGVLLDSHCRGLLRHARLEGISFPDPGDVFAEPSAWQYLNDRADDDSDTGAPVPLTRYLYALWDARPDLRAVFPDVCGADRERFIDWVSKDSWTAVDRAYLAGAGSRRKHVPGGRDVPGVNVAGYFRTESGVGEAGRAHVVALNAAGIPTRLVDFSAHAPSRDRDASIARGEASGDHRINLVCVNADQVPKFVEETGPAFFAGRYNIGSWWWELPKFPEMWTDAFGHFDEIWAGTQFTAAAIAQKSPIPVVLIPPVVRVGAVRGGQRQQFGLSADETVFLFVFDFLSVFARKNPLGVVEAFRRAFPDRGERVRLVLKSINGERDPANLERLLSAISDDSRITLVSDYYTRAQKNELLAACDAYVSLHRSEGFGYTLAEAMALGKPVIATSWSGPADFLTLSNGFPVGYDLVELGQDHGPYTADQVWAEPDLDDAARAMRAVRAEPAHARALGERARADITSRYSAAAVAKIVGERIARIDERAGPALLLSGAAR